jgi:hypothetical protein
MGRLVRYHYVNSNSNVVIKMASLPSPGGINTDSFCNSNLFSDSYFVFRAKIILIPF